MIITKNLFGVPIYSYFSHSKHLWMWDFDTTYKELEIFGFKYIEIYNYGDYFLHPEFKLVESKERFMKSFAIQCYK
jgi:hypothetical protein